jgi:hypothetical protein
MIRRLFAILCAGLLLPATAPLVRGQDTDEEEEPSAVLIIDAEEAVLEDPMLEPDEDPLPPLGEDTFFPGEEDLFGPDLFGGMGMDFFDTPSAPVIPDRPPLIEDPKEVERKQRIQLQRLKAGLNRDPELVALEQTADQARTPEDYRAARRAYYALFFQKVRAADPTLTAMADKLEKSSLAPLYQTRIEPTLALNPPPLPQPAPEFIPQPQFPPADTFFEDLGPLP